MDTRVQELLLTSEFRCNFSKCIHGTRKDVKKLLNSIGIKMVSPKLPNKAIKAPAHRP